MISQCNLKIWAIKTVFSHLSIYIGMRGSCSVLVEVPTKHTLISFFSINQTFSHVFFSHFISELSAESSSRSCFLLMLPFQKCITILNNQPRLFSKSTLFIYLGSVKGNVFKKFKHKTPHKCITSARKEWLQRHKGQYCAADTTSQWSIVSVTYSWVLRLMEIHTDHLMCVWGGSYCSATRCCCENRRVPTPETNINPEWRFVKLRQKE